MCFAGVLGRRVTSKLHLGVKVVAAKAMVVTLTEVRMVVATLAGVRAVALALVEITPPHAMTVVTDLQPLPEPRHQERSIIAMGSRSWHCVSLRTL